MDNTRLYPEALDLITSLRSKKLAILSNKRQAFCDPIVKGLGLTPFFEMVVGGDKLAKKKPDPEPILYICTALNISPSDAVMIGDSPIDVEAGKAAGCLTVGIEKGFCKPSDVAASQPDFLIHTLANFKDLQDR